MNYFERLNYNPATGVFTWNVSAPGIKAGKKAGCISVHGYEIVKVGRVAYRANRLAWFMANGHWPDGEVDLYFKAAQIAAAFSDLDRSGL